MADEVEAQRMRDFRAYDIISEKEARAQVAAVNAARQLARPSAQADEYVDEALQFLFSTSAQTLTYNCQQPLHETLFMSSDAAFADVDGAKSSAGWVSMVAGAAWAWQVETLRLTVLSSTEAEYCAQASACKEILAQQRLFAAFQLQFPQQYVLMCDNHSAIALACGPAVHYQRTKHIATKYHFQRQLVLEGVVRMQHQSTEVQISDILTKDLGKEKHKQHRRVLFGDDAIKVISVALPESQKLYVRRHNEELAQRLKKQDLETKFRQHDDVSISSDISKQHALVAAIQALLTVVSN